MSVSLLLCEGAENSPDIRVLSRVLAGQCAILPSGGKYGMGERIKARREVIGQKTVFGLLDGDYTNEWTAPRGRPREWKISSGELIGWRWERKEIENYLIDPMVVKRARPDRAHDDDAYRAALEHARDELAEYQSARLALSISRPRFRQLVNAFGRQRGRLAHVMPDDLSQPACLDGLRNAVAAHNAGQSLEIATVEALFYQRRTECATGGPRFTSYMIAFAGKDLLHAMAADLKPLGHDSPAQFLERVLVGIENARDEVASWVDEWTALRQIVSET